MRTIRRDFRRIDPADARVVLSEALDGVLTAYDPSHRRGGVPGPARPHRLARELDSLAWHFNHESFHCDPVRRNRLLVLGWRVLTVTWAEHADRLVATVRDALGGGSPGGGAAGSGTRDRKA